VPVSFANRSRGESKLGVGDALEFFLSACSLRWRRRA
jgi:hypothetical protein